jgi:hypothetical protein
MKIFGGEPMTTRTWFGGTGSFTDAGDWSPAGVPMPGDEAIFLAGTLDIDHQNLADIPLTYGGDFPTKSVLDLKGSVIGPVMLQNDRTGAVEGIHTINVSNYAVFVGPLSTNELEESTTINISPHSLLLNFGSLQFVTQLGASLDIAGTKGAVVANYGLIEVEAPGATTAIIAPSVTGHGTIQVGSSDVANTEFGGFVGSGQTFEFSGFDDQASSTATATLQVDMAREFHATIANFTAVDTIDLKGVTVTSDDFNNGVLTLKDGSETVANLHFAGSYTTSDFVTQAVAGDTLIKHV